MQFISTLLLGFDISKLNNSRQNKLISLRCMTSDPKGRALRMRHLSEILKKRVAAPSVMASAAAVWKF